MIPGFHSFSMPHRNILMPEYPDLCRRVSGGIDTVTVCHEGHKINALTLPVFIPAVHGVVLGSVCIFPVIRRVTTNPRHICSTATMALRVKHGEVSTKLCQHGCKQRRLLCVGGGAHVKLTLHPADGQQNVFGIFLQCRFCAGNQILI